MTILMTHFSQEDISLKPDEEILAFSIDRPALFEMLVKKYEKAFLRKAQMLLGPRRESREEAEDAVQETFMKIYFNASRFRSVPGASFQSWGYKILTNTCFTLYKKRKRREEGRVWMSGEEGSHGTLENLPDIHFRHAKEEEDIREQALSFISMLPSNMRRVLQMHFLDGLKQKEIAEVEGVTVGAVKIRIFRAKKELQKIYEHDKQK